MEITLFDKEYSAETMMMLQAFYSRNHKPIKTRLDEMGSDEDAVKKSLEKWLVQYSHKSIGQDAGFTIFIENVSILAAKAIQDSPLYNGIETSTRYIDFSNQEMYSPFVNKIQQTWLDFYTENHDTVLNHVATTFNLDLSVSIEFKTAKARTFDILRGFLPAGSKTQLSWFTSFTHASDRLVQLKFHPLEEVRNIADKIIEECKLKFPYAFSGIDKDIERYGDYYNKYAVDLNYYNYDESFDETWDMLTEMKVPCYICDFCMRITDDWHNDDEDMMDRPKGLGLSRVASYSGRFNIIGILDFGSYRDLQRHRACTQLQPILTTKLGFNKWYIESLPESISSKALDLIEYQTKKINELYNKTDLQYLIPLGFNVGFELDCDLPQLVYMSEIRTGKTVHPTLRIIAKEFAKVAEKYVPIYDDKSEDEIDLRRGMQDIIEK